METPKHPNFRAASQPSFDPIPLGVDTQTQRGQNPNQLHREQRAFRRWSNIRQLLDLHRKADKQPFEQGLATDIFHLETMIQKDHYTTKLYLQETALDWEFGNYTKVFVTEGTSLQSSRGTRLKEMHVLSPEGRYYILEILPFMQGEEALEALGHLGIRRDEEKPVQEVPGFLVKPGFLIDPSTTFYAQ